jgi:hypothetical protein
MSKSGYFKDRPWQKEARSSRLSSVQGMTPADSLARRLQSSAYTGKPAVTSREDIIALAKKFKKSGITAEEVVRRVMNSFSTSGDYIRQVLKESGIRGECLKQKSRTSR